MDRKKLIIFILAAFLPMIGAGVAMHYCVPLLKSLISSIAGG